MKTIRELAESAGVSKTAIRQRLKDLDLMQHTERDERNVLYVPDDVANKIIESFRNRPVKSAESTQKAQETQQQKVPQSENNVLDVLAEQLRAKDNQIAELQSANSKLLETINRLQETVSTVTAALSNAQALHAGSIQTFQQIAAQKPEAVTHTEKDPTEHTKTEPANGGNVVTHEPEQAVTEPAQSATERNTEPKRAITKEQPPKGLWGLFKRK